jgi:Cdc6-like AAA superfamily ATPase
MMTRKHHRQIAEIIRDRREEADDFGITGLFDAMILDFCVLLERDNPRFDSDKFKEACDFDVAYSDYEDW